MNLASVPYSRTAGVWLASASVLAVISISACSFDATDRSTAASAPAARTPAKPNARLEQPTVDIAGRSQGVGHDAVQ